MTRRIHFHVGGPNFHPVADQADVIREWLGAEYDCRKYEGVEAFRHLDDCDLFVLMGLHWTGMSNDGLTYNPMTQADLDALNNYVASGRPVLAHHGAIASSDDTPQFADLIGVRWRWGTSTHSPFGRFTVRVLETGHPVVKGLADYIIDDELYYNLEISPEMDAQIHAEADWDGAARPMIVTAEGGRIPGAGRLVYLANGHDLRAFECPAMRTLWTNAVEWLLDA